PRRAGGGAGDARAVPGARRRAGGGGGDRPNSAPGGRDRPGRPVVVGGGPARVVARRGRPGGRRRGRRLGAERAAGALHAEGGGASHGGGREGIAAPPFGRRTGPVTNAEASEARYSTGCATSSVTHPAQRCRPGRRGLGVRCGAGRRGRTRREACGDGTSGPG